VIVGLTLTKVGSILGTEIYRLLLKVHSTILKRLKSKPLRGASGHQYLEPGRALGSSGRDRAFIILAGRISGSKS